jgi:dolichyl-phosphate-mannose--protein O-mannosyl transferase
MGRDERILWVVCGALLCAAVVVRAYQLDVPAELSFDERHFVNNARRYLGGRLDQNDHPPLGKLLIALSMGIFGDTSFGWRVPSLVAGWANIGLAFALGARLFRSRVAGLLAATLVGIDGFFLVYSRTALMDGVLVTAMYTSALGSVVAWQERRVWPLAVAAVFAGLAASIKFSGVVFVVPLVIAAGWRWRVWPVLALAPMAYAAVMAGALTHTGQPPDVVGNSLRLLGIHLGKADGSNKWLSAWYEWFVPTRPIVLRYRRSHGLVRAMVTLGNLAMWWSSALLVLRAAAALLRAPVDRMLGKQTPDQGFYGEHRAAIAWLLLLWLLPLAPWMVSGRDPYLYHYLPSYGFALILLAGGLTWLFRTRPGLAWAALTGFVAVSAVYLPVWAELPIRTATWEWLRWVPPP